MAYVIVTIEPILGDLYAEMPEDFANQSFEAWKEQRVATNILW
jgi:hypothetical protein